MLLAAFADSSFPGTEFRRRRHIRVELYTIVVRECLTLQQGCVYLLERIVNRLTVHP